MVVIMAEARSSHAIEASPLHSLFRRRRIMISRLVSRGQHGGGTRVGDNVPFLPHHAHRPAGSCAGVRCRHQGGRDSGSGSGSGRGDGACSLVGERRSLCLLGSRVTAGVCVSLHVPVRAPSLLPPPAFTDMAMSAAVRGRALCSGRSLIRR